MPKIETAQLLYLQENYKGGISMDGKSYLGMKYPDADTINFQNSVPVGSIIKKAFLISRHLLFGVGAQKPNDPLMVLFNSDSVKIDSSNIVTQAFYCNNSTPTNRLWMIINDVTSYTIFSGNKLVIPAQNLTLGRYLYDGFLLIILYENNTMPSNNVEIFLNNQNYSNTMAYPINGMNPINISNDVGLSFWVTNAVSVSKISFALNSSLGNFPLGSLWGAYTNIGNEDEATLPGSFYYENNTLFGLVDDTPDAFIDSTDALANIKTYVLNNTTTFSLTATLPSVASACGDAINAFILAYSTPCPARSITPTQTFTLCSSNSIQLAVSSQQGGNIYSWYPGSGLNDSTIANPVATPTLGTTNYIAYVDSAGCKHTEHFSIAVYPNPKADTLLVSNAICGNFTAGAVTISNTQNGLLPYNFNIGGANQSSNSFSNINPGTYTATVTDSRGCVYKKPFTVIEVNNAIASFSFSPNVACVNEPVNFTNTSGGANLQWWHFFGNDTSNAQNPSYIFADTGFYNVTLIAWSNQKNCSDTIIKSIYVKECPPDSISIIAPNIFTPNADGINDTWQVNIYNSGFTILEFNTSIYDRWGLQVYSSSTALGMTNSGWDGHTTSGTECSEGTYYYVVSYKATSLNNEVKQQTLRGFLQLNR